VNVLTAAIEESGLRVYPLAREVSLALEGAVYPLRRDQLVAIARENGSPSTLLSLLHLLPDRDPLESLDQVEALLAD
jgi:hypothetical protein